MREPTTFQAAVAHYLRSNGWVQVQADDSTRIYWTHDSLISSRSLEIERALWLQMRFAYNPFGKGLVVKFKNSKQLDKGA